MVDVIENVWEQHQIAMNASRDSVGSINTNWHTDPDSVPTKIHDGRPASAHWQPTAKMPRNVDEKQCTSLPVMLTRAEAKPRSLLVVCRRVYNYIRN